MSKSENYNDEGVHKTTGKYNPAYDKTRNRENRNIQKVAPHLKAIKRMPMTEERLMLFLDVLSETGSMPAAAAAASPHCKYSGYTSFLDYAKRHPEFAEAIECAKQMAIGKVEKTIMERAMMDYEEPVVSMGDIVGTKIRHDNTLLVKWAKRLNPDAWADQQHVRHSGMVAGVLVVPAMMHADDWAKENQVEVIDVVEEDVDPGEDD